MNFNPIIVLFLTLATVFFIVDNNSFQSYYSLIFNLSAPSTAEVGSNDFNPIIVLFLTFSVVFSKSMSSFQSYYSLIFNSLFVPCMSVSISFQSYYSLIFNGSVNVE